MAARAAILDVEEFLQRKARSFRSDPLGYVKYFYQWGKDGLAESIGPRVWQGNIFSEIGNHLKNSVTRFTPLLVAVSSGHGIGKSALISMVCQWGMSTCVDCKIIVTANTGTQLATKTAPEIAKWFNLAINKHWFEVKATSITIQAPEHERLWRLDTIPWSENNTEAFAGAHNKGKRIIIIMDEASGIADKVWEVTEGALTDENTEIIWLAFGNPTQNTGRFRECFGKLKHRWKTFQIDSRTVEGTNKAQLDKWVEDYGEDSDWVRVRVRGEFPRAGSSQFIAGDIVAAARKYKAESYASLPKILSVDVARFGDDQTVLLTRQGRKASILAKLRGLDTVQVAERVIEAMQKESPDAVVIDGDGIGAGVVDHIRFRGFSQRLFEFHGGAAANDSAMFYNRRAEVWGSVREWLSAGAQIPDDPELEADLTSPEYGFSNKQQIQLERKEDMKKRGLSSPDCGDALAMSFSVNVLPKPKQPAKVMSYPGERSQGWMG